MDNRTLLSGSFSELRATHFHTGIDIRTGGKTGLPIRSVKDGILVRIKISPFGYGRALYVAHSDGTTSVYGHLERFTPVIENLIHSIQYKKESFSIDEDVSIQKIRFKMGDIIAYSGNSGSSGGPHLHFEIRETQSEKPLNPLAYISVVDNIAPIFKALYLYTATADGRIEPYSCDFTINEISTNRFNAGTIQVPCGQIGIGVFVTDGMNDTFNRLGIYELTMHVDSVEYFHYTADKVNFSNAKYVNEFKDYWHYRDEKQTVYRLFGYHLHKLDGIRMNENGFIETDSLYIRQVSIKMKDYNGNYSLVSFKLKGSQINSAPSSSTLNYALGHSLSCGNYQLQIADNSLIRSIDPICFIDSMSDNHEIRRETFFATLTEEPLLKSAIIRYNGSTAPHTLICIINAKNQISPLYTRHDSLGLQASVSTLGRYTLAQDTIAPTITYLGLSGGRLLFKVRDDFSGIESYKGEVNDRWCLFEYDAKSNLIFCKRSEKNFIRGKKNSVVIQVEDCAGNKSKKYINYLYK